MILMKEEEESKRSFYEEELMKDRNNKYCLNYRAIKEVVTFIMIIDINIKITNSQTTKDLNY